MKILNLPRGKGKTTFLIILSSLECWTIVCPTLRDVKRVEKTAKLSGFILPPVLTFTAYIEGYLHDPHIKGFLFDDLDRSLDMNPKVLQRVSLETHSRINQQFSSENCLNVLYQVTLETYARGLPLKVATVTV